MIFNIQLGRCFREVEARLCVQELAAGLIRNIGQGRPIRTVRQPQALITGRASCGAREITPPYLEGTFSLRRQPGCFELGLRFACQATKQQEARSPERQISEIGLRAAAHTSWAASGSNHYLAKIFNCSTAT